MFNLKKWILNSSKAISHPILVGSQVLVESVSGTGAAETDSWHMAIESPYKSLLNGLKNIDYSAYFPNGYHFMYRVTWFGTTGGGNTSYVKINSIDCGYVRTWSVSTYVSASGSAFFNEDQLGQEPIPTYSYPGITVYYKSEGGATSYTIKDITLHCYVVPN